MFLNGAIAAIATARGTGGIAVIRISGSAAFEIGGKIFLPRNKKFKALGDIPANTAIFGDISDPDTGRIIDEGIAVKFKSPYSYTGEDTVEISCHGGVYIANAVLNSAIKAGARLAEPGEFTKTAYINGRISLTGAEAVGRLISASGEAGARLAAAQTKGALSRKISGISDILKDIISEVYVFIDYPGEDLTDMTPEIMLEKLIYVKNELEKLKESYNTGRIISDGINCVIIGRPNAGKSTLLNMLSQSDAAIVHETPGTTRDIVYAKISVNGFVLNLYDTAGIRETDGEIENIGIERALAKISESDLIIGVFDASGDLCGDDYNILEILRREENSGKKIIAVSNKCDEITTEQKLPLIIESEGSFAKSLMISAKNNTVLNSGVSARDEFGIRLADLYNLDGYDLDSGEILTEERQYFEICAACENLNSAAAALENGYTQDVAGMDLELAVKNL